MSIEHCGTGNDDKELIVKSVLIVIIPAIILGIAIGIFVHLTA